jgi:microcystin-dependent protein
MSNCSNCYNGCTEIISDRCVKYTGIDVPVLGIQTGDSLSFVEQALITFLTSAIDGTGIKPIIDPQIICDLVQANLPNCGDLSLNDILSAIIKSTCDLQDQVDVIVAELAILNGDYNVGCLTGVTSSSDTHSVLQATITALCTLRDEFDQLVMDLPDTYVQLDQLNTLIQDYLDSLSTGLISNKMVPFSVVPYFGSLSYFNSTGAGIIGSPWEKIYLCNGENGTPDLRGRALTGAIVNVPGNSLDPSVLPSPGSGNPNYAIFDEVGANQITLSSTQIPLHTHANTAIVNDPTHTHQVGPTGKGVLGILDTGSTTRQFQNANTNNTPLQSTFFTAPASTGITVSINNVAGPAGGGLPHSNIQPVTACYWIMYKPY